MPLYELFSITRAPAATAGSILPDAQAKIRDVMRRSAIKLFGEKALIRDIRFMGIKRLPYRMKLGADYQYEGAYWLMHFYSGSQAVRRVGRDLSLDPDMIRCTILKKGDKLKDYAMQTDQ